MATDGSDLQKVQAIIEELCANGGSMLPFRVLLAFAFGSPSSVCVSAWLSSVAEVLVFAKKATAAGSSLRLEMVRPLEDRSGFWRTSPPRLIPRTPVTNGERSFSPQQGEKAQTEEEGAIDQNEKNKADDGNLFRDDLPVSLALPKRFRLRSFQQKEQFFDSTFPTVTVSLILVK